MLLITGKVLLNVLNVGGGNLTHWTDRACTVNDMELVYNEEKKNRRVKERGGIA